MILMQKENTFYRQKADSPLVPFMEGESSWHNSAIIRTKFGDAGEVGV